jgi:acyl-CoA synthetase (NDP forming)
MDVGAIFDQAVRDGRPALNEALSKKILAHYGVPVVEERTVSDPVKAVAAAETIGFPVVVKALGSSLLHKSEQNLVHLNLTDASAVQKAAEAAARRAGDALEGILVQRQAAGRRELVAGLFHDRIFGPVVMFGLGGVFTEALSDVAFRLAPLGRIDAYEMIGEIRSAKLLGSFRGEAAADRERLADVLIALSRIGTEHPTVSEIDVNPLIVSPEGEVTAVDALIVARPQSEPAGIDGPAPVAPEAIGNLFYPKSIAFVGASAQLGKWGNLLVNNTVAGGYRGGVHLVNPKGGTIAGRPVHRSVADVPEAVDLAVVTVPARGVPGLIPQLAEKGIRYMVLITSGFSETGNEGRKREKELVRAASDAGILILGPNTMGICNPHIDLYCTGSPVRPRAGSTAVVAQSGNMGTQLLGFAQEQDIGVRAFSGSGNEAMITIEDYLDGFQVDEKSRTVMLYVESVKNGRRFFDSAREVVRQKPIVLLKGGRSEAGNKAASSHTGAMASDARIFDAVCRQAGIVQVQQPMELLDLAAAFSSLPPPRGNRTAILTLGGGWGVVTADLCQEHGLEIPELPASLLHRIDGILPPYWSRANPIDIVGETDPSIPMRVVEALLEWEGCDGVINLGIMGRRIFIERTVQAARKVDPAPDRELLDAACKMLESFERDWVEHLATLMDRYEKPVYGVSLFKDHRDRTVYRVPERRHKAVFYESPEQAVKAFARMTEYGRYLAARR